MDADSFDSTQYWEQRYRKNKNGSGDGSYGRLAQFKAKVINAILAKSNPSSVIDYGVGDGNQLRSLKIPETCSYLGLDVSPTTIANLRKDKSLNRFRFEAVPNAGRLPYQADVTMSMDVLYHLVEKQVFDAYVKNLFSMAKKMVIVYARDADEKVAIHVVCRPFVSLARSFGWQVRQKIPNMYPVGKDKSQKGVSLSSFWVFTPTTPLLGDPFFDINTRSLFDELTEESRRHGPVAGNLVYEHNKLGSLASGCEIKRENLCDVCSHVREGGSMMEIGFNSGYSALIMLLANPTASLVAVDICEHAYAKPCAAILKRRFGDRFTLVEGSSLDVVPEMTKKFDLFHIDGAYHLRTPDITNCLGIANEGAVFVIDDTNSSKIDEEVRKFRQLDIVSKYERFSPEHRYRHRVLRLLSSPRYDRRFGWCTRALQK